VRQGITNSLRVVVNVPSSAVRRSKFDHNRDTRIAKRFRLLFRYRGQCSFAKLTAGLADVSSSGTMPPITIY
jgi:hypothetical protein